MVFSFAPEKRRSKSLVITPRQTTWRTGFEVRHADLVPCLPTPGVSVLFTHPPQLPGLQPSFLLLRDLSQLVHPLLQIPPLLFFAAAEDATHHFSSELFLKLSPRSWPETRLSLEEFPRLFLDRVRTLRNPPVGAKVSLSGRTLVTAWFSLAEGRLPVARKSGITVALGCEPPAPMLGASVCPASSLSPGGWSHTAAFFFLD